MDKEVMMERIAVALERIAENLTTENVLVAKRLADAKRQAKHRKMSRDCHVTERTEEAKEGKIPHTPLKGEREEEKKDLRLCSARARTREDERFDLFWKSYPGPRKVDKKLCRAKFDAILANSPDPDKMLETILKGIENWKKGRDWSMDDGAYTCAPLVWLNRGRWNDHVEEWTPSFATRPCGKSDNWRGTRKEDIGNVLG